VYGNLEGQGFPPPGLPVGPHQLVHLGQRGADQGARRVDVDRHKIDLKETLKSVGAYSIGLRLSKNLDANLKIEVVHK